MIRPKLDTIVVRQEAEPEFSKGGIALIPKDQTQLIKEEMKGEIVAVGPGKYDKKGRRDTMWGLQSGMKISFSPVCCVPIEDNGDKYLMIKRDSVIGLV